MQDAAVPTVALLRTQLIAVDTEANKKILSMYKEVMKSVFPCVGEIL